MTDTQLINDKLDALARMVAYAGVLAVSASRNKNSSIQRDYDKFYVATKEYEALVQKGSEDKNEHNNNSSGIENEVS